MYATFLTFLNSKRPSASDREKLTNAESRGCSSIIVAPGSTAPEVSCTTPRIVTRFGFWALAQPQQRKNKSGSSKRVGMAVKVVGQVAGKMKLFY